jgi:hypothetical protein
MAFSLRTLKMLWGRAAARCSMPECRVQLVEDATDTDDEALIGEACHIVADSPDGPRGESDLTAEQRDKYGNLVLLCRNDHRIIDQQPEHFTVEVLHELKMSMNIGLERDWERSTPRSSATTSNTLPLWTSGASEGI